MTLLRGCIRISRRCAGFSPWKHQGHGWFHRLGRPRCLVRGSASHEEMLFIRINRISYPADSFLDPGWLRVKQPVLPGSTLPWRLGCPSGPGGLVFRRRDLGENRQPASAEQVAVRRTRRLAVVAQASLLFRRLPSRLASICRTRLLIHTTLVPPTAMPTLRQFNLALRRFSANLEIGSIRAVEWCETWLRGTRVRFEVRK
jgi:hypothetical protein